MNTLRPIYDFDTYSVGIAKEIYAELYRAIFGPLEAIINGSEPALLNAKSYLEEALRSGKIQYINGFFIGNLNANLSKELRGIGARFNKLRKSYALDLSDLPQTIIMAISAGNQKSKATLKKVEDFLKAVEGRQIKMKNLDPLFQKTLDGLSKQFQRTTRVVSARDIEVPLQKQYEDQLKEAYTENLNIYIQKWHDEQIIKLRRKVAKNVEQGFRAEELISTIQSQKRVSYNKAKFLAKQETSLMVSKYRQIRYEEVGITKYMWSTSKDKDRVRDDHKKLQGKIFRFDSPPVTDLHTMARNNPGEDFNCIPADSNVNLAYGIEKIFRRWYTGELTTLITNSGKTIRATPNHKVLTLRGWVPISILDNTDHLIDLSNELVDPSTNNIDNGIVTIGEIFNSFSLNFTMLTTKGSVEQFHGDGSNSDIYVIDTTRGLGIGNQSYIIQRFNKLFLSFTNSFASSVGAFCEVAINLVLIPIRGSILLVRNSPSFFSNVSQLFSGRILKSNEVSFGTTTDMNSSIQKPTANDGTLETSSFRNRNLTLAPNVGINNRLWVKFKSIIGFSTNPSIGLESNTTKTLRKIIRIKADDLCRFGQGLAISDKADGVVKVTTENFSGHIYNLQTINNWYCVNGIIIHNCRCTAIPVLNNYNMLDAETSSARGKR